MSSTRYNVVVLPDAVITAQAYQTSQELEPLGTRFTLAPGHFIPHCSLFMVILKNEDLQEISAALTTIATKTPILTLEATKYFQEWGFIDAEYVRTPAIADLQITVADALNPLRDGMRPRDRELMRTVSAPERRSLEQYGYRSIGESFRPHLTLTRFVNEHPVPVEDMPHPSVFSGQFATLALCEMGDNGTCVKKIMEFSLQ